MSIVKSFSVGNGDMFYIEHNTDNFTIIDCCLQEDSASAILKEIETKSESKGISRFISTHPDQDHLSGLTQLDQRLPIMNFYCVENSVQKAEETVDFKKYCELRDSDKAFYIYKGCERKWMNLGGNERGASGIHILWPDTSNIDYKNELKMASNGSSPNNISPIIEYYCDSGRFLWMGDLETDFMNKIEKSLSFSQTAILFAPHHGRESGKVPEKLLKKMNPQIIVIGEAPSEHLNYYSGYNTITQNSAGDIIFDNNGDFIDIYVSNDKYSVKFLKNRYLPPNHDAYYLGSLKVS